MGAPLKILAANPLGNAKPPLPHQLERLVQQGVQLLVTHCLAVGLGRRDIVPLGRTHLIKVTPGRRHLGIQGHSLFHRPPRLTQTPQPFQCQTQLVVGNLQAGVDAQGAAQQRFGPGVIARTPQCKSMQHHQAGVIRILLPGLGTQISRTGCILIP